MLKKGPEIKLPELKAPDFLLDIYYDLRERHLLPLVAVLALAIVAVPIAFADPGSDESETPLPNISAAASQAKNADEIVVGKSEPGLRDYRRRLKHLDPQDPFKPLSSASEGSGGGDSTPTEGGEETSVSGEEPTSPSTPPSEPGSEEPTHTITYFSYAVDVRVVPVSTNGKPSKAKPSVRRNLPELTQLPSRSDPAIVFMGVTHDTKKAVMLVSSEVKAIFGDAICVVGSESCQLLAMEPGVPETFVLGENRKTVRIEVLKLEFLETDKLNRAPLGKPKNKQKQR